MLWRCGLRSVHYCIAIALYSDGPMVNQCSEQWRPSSRGRMLTPRYMAVSFAVFIPTFVRAYRERIRIYCPKRAVSKTNSRLYQQLHYKSVQCDLEQEFPYFGSDSRLV